MNTPIDWVTVGATDHDAFAALAAELREHVLSAPWDPGAADPGLRLEYLRQRTLHAARELEIVRRMYQLQQLITDRAARRTPE